jgi:peptide deformylase
VRENFELIYDNLNIIHYPDPRLKAANKLVERFDDRLRLLAARMFELMRQSKGVGLAAPQVGMNLRLFVMNPTGQAQDDRVYVNPVLCDGDGFEEEDEGCLSLPGLSIRVERFRTLRITAQDLDGNPIDQLESGYLPRIWQHEYDHLNGVLLTDRMGPVAKLANRRLLKKLQEEYAAAHPAPVAAGPKKMARSRGR